MSETSDLAKKPEPEPVEQPTFHVPSAPGDDAKTESAAPPPTYVTPAPVEQRVRRYKQVPEIDAYGQEVEEDEESDSSVSSDIEHPVGRAAQYTKRFFKKSFKVAKKHAKVGAKHVKKFTHHALHTDQEALRLYDEGNDVAELLRQEFTLDQLCRVLEMDHVEHLCEAGLRAPLVPQFWTRLADEFGLRADHLATHFGLHNFEEYLDAGLRHTQLAKIGFNMNGMIEDGRINKMMLCAGRNLGWTAQTWVDLGMEYGSLMQLGLERGEYKSLLGVKPMDMALALGIIDMDTPVSFETEAHLNRIGIYFG